MQSGRVCCGFVRLLANARVRHLSVPGGTRWALNKKGPPLLQAAPGLCCVCRHYARNPMERLPMDNLKGSVSGGGGGRKGRGRRAGGRKGMRDTQAIWIGQGKGGERWPGLSHPIDEVKYSMDWLKKSELGMKKVAGSEVSEGDPVQEEKQQFMLHLRQVEGRRRNVRRVSEMGWDKRGWSGILWGGRHVGCPELPDGTPLEDFQSVVIHVKRVSTQTSGGKKRSLSVLVVIGNGNGMAGYAVGKGEELRAAIRKAKNKAVNYLQFIPRCDDHTIYHNVNIKHCKTNIELERRVKGHGLRCHRAVSAISQLAGIKDMRAKVTGSNHPLNVVRAAFKGLTSQESFQELANRTGKFVVEYRRESLDRPVVVAVPTSQQDVWQELADLQLSQKQSPLQLHS